MSEQEGEEFRVSAEKHWTFIKKILDETKRTDDTVETIYYRGSFLHLMYVEAMVHGYKHGKQEYNSEHKDEENNKRIQSMVEKL